MSQKHEEFDDLLAAAYGPQEKPNFADAILAALVLIDNPNHPISKAFAEARRPFFEGKATPDQTIEKLKAFRVSHEDELKRILAPGLRRNQDRGR